MDVVNKDVVEMRPEEVSLMSDAAERQRKAEIIVLTDSKGKKHLVSEDELELLDLYHLTGDRLSEMEHIRVHVLLNRLYIIEIISEAMSDLKLPPEKISVLQFIKWMKIKEKNGVYGGMGKMFPCYKCWEQLLNGEEVKSIRHDHSVNQELALKSLNWGF